MAKVLLVTENEVKDKSIIEANVDSKVLSNTIWNVQELQLKQIMGGELYLRVLSEVDSSISNTTPLSSATKELIDAYIVPFLIYAVICDFIIVHNYKLSNKGVMKLNDNSGVSSNTNDLEYVKNHYENQLTVFKKRLVEYLKTQSLSVPNNADSNVTSSAIGWYLEPRRKGCLEN